MKTIELLTSAKETPVLIGAGLLNEAGERLAAIAKGRKAIIITNPLVNEIYAPKVRACLEQYGFTTVVILVPDGEQYKSLRTAGYLYTRLSRFQADRATPVIALGGGVIGDLAGFVAATYLRGVPLIHLPTTLVGQVDSSIGGKVAVNHRHLKNRIGTFYMPELVMSDIETLQTLPDKEIRNGLAEVVKAAAISDYQFFAFLEKNLDAAKGHDSSTLEEIVFRTAQIKATIVAQDEKDMGPRHVLNFGHTVGHALEAASHFAIPHGEAVSIGMVVAARISTRLGLLSDTDAKRLGNLLERIGLPTSLPELSRREIVKAIGYDKKITNGSLNFVLLNGLGHAVLWENMDISLIKEALDEAR